MTTAIDWDEAYRVAACSKYDCVPEFDAVKAEVEAELAKPKPCATLFP